MRFIIPIAVLTALLISTSIASANVSDAASPRIEDNPVKITIHQSDESSTLVTTRMEIAEREFEVGEAIPITVTVTNTSDVTIRYSASDPNQDYLKCYIITVYNSRGRLMPNPLEGRPILMGGLSADTNLAPGKSVTYKTYINKYAYLNEPGVYTAKVTWQPHGSTTSSPSPKSESDALIIKVIHANHFRSENRLQEALTQLDWARSHAEKIDALKVLSYTLDNRALPHIVKTAREQAMLQPGEEALYYYKDKQAVRDALISDFKASGPCESFAYIFSHFKIPIVQLYPDIKHWLKTGDAQQRTGALMMLFTSRDKVADQEFTDLLTSQLSDSDATVRHHAIEALASFKAAYEAVEEAAKHDEDKWVRGQAVIALGWYKNDRAVPVLKQFVLDEIVSRGAIDALRSLGTPAAKTALEECVKITSGNTQQQCKEALQDIERDLSKQDKPK